MIVALWRSAPSGGARKEQVDTGLGVVSWRKTVCEEMALRMPSHSMQETWLVEQLGLQSACEGPKQVIGAVDNAM
jgi:hypothetical protein